MNLSSSILWNNSASGGGCQLGLHSNTYLDITASDIEGIESTGDVFQDNGGNSVNYAAANLNADPLFVDQDGINNIQGDLDDNVLLQSGSPCVDAGALLPADLLDLDNDGDRGELIPVDIYGIKRISGDNPDIGAAEYYPHGLSANYSTGSQVMEEMIFHGYSSGCTATSNNKYQGVCTPPAQSPVNWAWDSFSVDWTGYIYAPVDGVYSFSSNYWVDGTVYVKIGDTVIADFNTGGGGYGKSIYLHGKSFVPATISFASNGGSNNMTLGWRIPGMTQWQPLVQPWLVESAPGVFDLDSDCDVDGRDFDLPGFADSFGKENNCSVQ